MCVNRISTRRWTSWYDDRLVTQAGEDILRDYDTHAIQELRSHHLIWSSWGNSRALSPTDYSPIPDTPYGVRAVIGLNSRKLRIFYLSLLWRAAATKLPEFSGVVLPSDDLEQLRLMVLNRLHEPLSFYPIQLIQLSTKGRIHNYTPTAGEKIVPAYEAEPERAERVFRFYFDGLIAHFNRQASDDGRTERLGELVLGNSHKLLVTTVTYEASRQFLMLSHVMTETYSKWPHAHKL
jgi:hypothetical protein